ncbi:MAG: DUF4412 domain-containing protein [Bacteroidota bacterium]
MTVTPLFRYVKRLGLFVLLAVFVIPSISAQSTIGKRAERNVKRKVDRKVDRAIDNGIDGAFEAVEGIFKKKNKKKKKKDKDKENKNESSTPAPTDSPAYPSEEVSVTIEEDPEADSRPVERSNFIGSFVMEMKEFKNGQLSKDSPIKIGYHIDAYQTGIEMEDKEEQTTNLIVYDRQARKMIMKMHKDGEKTAIINKLPSMKVTVEEEKYPSGKYSVTPTGRTKVIEGYNCKEFMVETEKEVSHVWFAEDLDTGLATSLNLGMVNVQRKDGSTLDYGDRYNLKGTWLEVHSKSKSENITRDIYLKNLVIGSVEQQIFSTDGYKVTDVSNLFGN